MDFLKKKSYQNKDKKRNIRQTVTNYVPVKFKKDIAFWRLYNTT